MELAGFPVQRIVLRLVEGIDATLLVIILSLSLLGFAALFSASYETPGRVLNQFVSLSIALIAMWLTAQIAPQTLMRFAVPAYVVGLLLLVLVALFGDVVNGARRWLHVGVTRFQPSEMMKLALPLMLAWYFHRRESSLRLRDFALAAVLLAMPVRPDRAPARPRHRRARRRGGLLRHLLRRDQLAGARRPRRRFSPWRCSRSGACCTTISVGAYLRFSIRLPDPLGAGYHIIQSTIAVGSGGISGKGWLNGTQAHLEFIPERHTDFIFAVYSEEFGLIGNVVLLVLYALLIGRGLVIAANAATLFARLMAGAVTLMFFTYAFVNMGMVSGILPVVGVPLPFLSYGGTALLTLFIGAGILMSVQRHRKLVQT